MKHSARHGTPTKILTSSSLNNEQDDPTSSAVEHVAWLIATKQSKRQAMYAIGKPYKRDTTWAHVVLAYAAHAIRMERDNERSYSEEVDC